MAVELTASNLELILVAVIAVGVAFLFTIQASMIVLRERQLQRRQKEFISERETLIQRADELEAAKTKIEEMGKKLKGLYEEKRTTTLHHKRASKSNVVMLHEIGKAISGLTCFAFVVKSPLSYTRKNQHRIIFHPRIWGYRNVAHVWAGELTAAHYLLQSIFNEKAGFEVTEVSGGGGGGALDGMALEEALAEDEAGGEELWGEDVSGGNVDAEGGGGSGDAWNQDGTRAGSLWEEAADTTAPG